jgi:RNA polymerase sigma-B factor
MIAERPAARDDAIDSYHYLCRRGARKFLRRGLDRRDLEQIAAIGLIKAWDRYDASSRTPFEAYAWLMIVGELMHHVRDFEHIVRVPRWLRGIDKQYVQAQERLSVRLEREPTRKELAEELAVPLSVVNEVECARHAVLAGVRDIAHSGSGDLDSISDRPAREWAEDRLLVDRALSALAPLERRVVLGVYALGMTQTEIARRVGLTARQIYRIHRGALSRMRATLTGMPTN